MYSAACFFRGAAVVSYLFIVPDLSDLRASKRLCFVFDLFIVLEAYFLSGVALSALGRLMESSGASTEAAHGDAQTEVTLWAQRTLRVPGCVARQTCREAQRGTADKQR